MPVTEGGLAFLSKPSMFMKPQKYAAGIVNPRVIISLNAGAVAMLGPETYRFQKYVSGILGREKSHPCTD